MNFLDLGQIPAIHADGIHDDTAAIQQCLDRMKDGGTIWFPDGIYRISACLIFYSHQRLLFSDDAVLLRAVDEGSEPTRACNCDCTFCSHRCHNDCAVNDLGHATVNVASAITADDTACMDRAKC
ncbi:MAG: hypothetical protein J6C42_11570 [Clostridia bacterium]|nr:hypothetical protein [Clostridia bacterium]